MAQQDGPTLVFRIVKGPSKFDLMVSLMNGDMNSRWLVKFEYKNSDSVIKIHSSMNVRIESLCREDGGGESWIFTGYKVTETGLLLKVKGYYYLPGRSGTISYTE